MTTITEPAPAKLNLALHVRARRADGYHELETVFAFVRDGDVLTVTPAAEPSFEIDGPFGRHLSPGDDNLVSRARVAFERHIATLPTFAIRLTKNLPVASGIGGGSADAAAMLRACARIAGVAANDPRLFAIAADLGSDIPACLDGRATIGRGRGERLQPLAGLSSRPVLLVNPGVAVSTRDVFARWDGIDRGPLPDDPLAGRNDLTAAAMAVAPVIGDVIAALDASGTATFVRMSGSGATCFALFDNDIDRDLAAQSIQSDHPDWWCLATRLA
ncbi:4-(cytidine 5'-diphospho)-2-C-methyl-D-erythritol kinase [Sphingomonas sp. RS2018]